MVATLELHCVVLDPEHIALACAFRCSDHLPHCEGRRWVHSNVHFSTCLIREPCLPRGETRLLCLEASKNKIHITDKILDGIFLGIKEGSEEFVVWALAGCVVCRTVKRRAREDAADRVFFNNIRGTLWRPVPDDEPREPREPREQPLRIDVRRVHADLLPQISTEPSKPGRVYTRNSVELPRNGYTLGLVVEQL